MGEISVNKLVSSIIRDYDRNNNGVIDIKDNGRDETFFDKRETNNQGDKTVITITRYSYDELFLKADKNKDNKVTREEITDIVNKYDKDKNGKLTARSFWDWLKGKPPGEFDVFTNEIPERSRIIHKDVIYHNPNQPGYPYPHSGNLA